MPQMADDDNELLPPFLRREPLDRSKPLPKWIAGGGQREWVMPDMSKYRKQEEGEEMARADNVLIENPDAPVEVWGRNADDTDVELAKTFASKAEFEAWYNPKKYPNSGGTSSTAITAILINAKIDTIDFEAKGPTSRPLSVPKQKAERVPAGDHGYIVNSHIGLLLKSKGFKRKTVAKGEPMTFANPDGREVVIPAPEEGKKSSSAWIVKGDNKEVAKGFGMGLKEKL